MYKTLYENARTMADRIQAGESGYQRKKQRSPVEGLMRKTMEETPEQREDMLTKLGEYIASVREASPKKEDTPDGPMRPEPRPRVVGAGISGDVGGRGAAEEYLGRTMSDEEWEGLVRATYAEATDDPREQAAVMSVILNRAKADNYPDSIVDVLNQRNQFQAVTGTAQNPGPSPRYQMLREGVLSKFETEVAPLLGTFQDKNWLNFTSGNPAAYGEGTNIEFLDTVRNAADSMQIGGTIFGTVR